MKTVTGTVTLKTDADKIFSEDDLQMFEELSERFLATVRRYAPAAGAKHTGGLLNMLRAVKRGMEEGKKSEAD